MAAKKAVKPMVVLAVSNQKGGVGKTTIATQTAFLAAELGLKVLLVEFDTQAHATLSMTGSRDLAQDPELHKNVLTTDKLFSDDVTEEPLLVRENIWLIPATRMLIDVRNLPEEEMQLPRKNLKKFDGQYDLCIIDTPPTSGQALFAALIASDKVVIPNSLDRYSYEGMKDTFSDIKYIKKEGWNTELTVIGIQINKRVAKSAGDSGALEFLREDLGELEYLINKNQIYERSAIRNAVMRPAWRTEKGALSKSKDGWIIHSACKEILKKAQAIK